MPGDSSSQVTALLQNWIQGDQSALSALIPVVHQELRRIAHYHLRSQRENHTLQSTALVNEAFVRLLGGQPAELRDRAHFMALASRLMRQILIDYSRTRGAQKRNGGIRIDTQELGNLPVDCDRDLIALDDALKDLSRIDERQSKVVEMKFFGGMSVSEIADVLCISPTTVDRDWTTARIWLFGHLRASSAP